MRKHELTEADAILQRALTVLLAQDPAPLMDPASADLRQAVGALRAGSTVKIAAGAVAADLFECFELAVAAGASFDGMGRVRLAVEAEAPQYLPGQLLAAALVRFCLIEEAQILSSTTFTSRDDVETAMDRYGAAIDRAVLYASDNFDQEVYVALTALAAAVTNDLGTRARPLPRMIAYQLPQSMPALWIAQRLYGDAARVAELVAENKIVHPCFCPLAIKGLSA
jgi:hypothetical protein